MYRRIGRVRSTHRSELTAQDRNDELGEHLELFEDGGLRQPGVIDQE